MTTVSIDPCKLPKTYRMTVQGLLHRCAGCQNWLPADDNHFVTDRGNRIGLGSLCLSCNRRRMNDWRRHNPAGAYAQSRRHLSRVAAASGEFTAEDREALLKQFGYHCVCCGKHESMCGRLEMDHVVPPPIGSNDIENRQPLCRECNARKSDTEIDYRPLWTRTQRRAA